MEQTKTIKIRTNGETYEYTLRELLASKSIITAAMVRQVLAGIQDSLREVFGEYKWSLDGYTGNYIIRADYPGGHFVEARGRTPREVLDNFTLMRTSL